MIDLTEQKYLKELFRYDPVSGKLYWRVNKSSRARIGVEANCLTKYGYYNVSIDYKRYLVHRIIWKMITGTDPDSIDHINGTRHDNRIENLRSVDTSINMKNKSIRKDNPHGKTGAYWNKQNKNWRATIGLNGKLKCLGSFKNKEDAVKARNEAELKYNFHENHGRSL